MPIPPETAMIARKRMNEMTAIDTETVFTFDESWRTVNMLRPR